MPAACRFRLRLTNEGYSSAAWDHIHHVGSRYLWPLPCDKDRKEGRQDEQRGKLVGTQHINLLTNPIDDNVGWPVLLLEPVKWAGRDAINMASTPGDDLSTVSRALWTLGFHYLLYPRQRDEIQKRTLRIIFFAYF